MKIGIATTTYNTGEYFEKHLESVQKQKFEGEIVHCIIDNGSTDDTVEVLKRSGVKYLTISPNTGGAATPYNIVMNALAESCDAVWRVDSDDFLNDPLAVQKMANLLVSSGKDWVNCHCLGFGEREWELGCVEGAKYKDFRDSNLLTCFGMFRSEVWIESGGYDEQCGYEDWELWIRLLKMGFRYAVLKDPVYSYRTHAVQQHKILGQKHSIHHDYIINKHFKSEETGINIKLSPR